jgi:hypothetical protein
VTGLKTYATAESVGWGLGTLFTNFEWEGWIGANGRHRFVDAADPRAS